MENVSVSVLAKRVEDLTREVHSMRRSMLERGFSVPEVHVSAKELASLKRFEKNMHAEIKSGKTVRFKPGMYR